jgi:ribosome biogenesis protein MAK21
LKLIGTLASGNKDTRDRYLILWSFEAKLKDAYKSFLTNLSEVSKDTIDKTRMKVMNIYLELLSANPEQEQELLSRLVNKLGDPTRSVAAKAIHQLGKLLEVHPAMTSIVLEEIEHLLYRPNVASKAQYYGICCLTQLLLDEARPEMANRLIKIYFSFFKV